MNGISSKTGEYLESGVPMRKTSISKKMLMPTGQGKPSPSEKIRDLGLIVSILLGKLPR